MCAAAIQRRKIALTIGNNNYERSPLRNCVNDANDLSGELRRIGFLVTSIFNLNCEHMEKEMNNFVASLLPGDFVFFFFAGHGLQWEDQNYLIPCNDTNIHDTYDLKYRAINAQRFLEHLSSKTPYVTVFLLDCCRNYSAPSMARGRLTGGLAQMTAPAGSVIGFACASGKSADDGSSNSQNGIFTKHILQHIARPDQEILMLLVDIADGVATETDGAQEPYLMSSLRKRNICFVGSTTNGESYSNKTFTQPTLIKAGRKFGGDGGNALDDSLSTNFTSSHYLSGVRFSDIDSFDACQFIYTSSHDDQNRIESDVYGNNGQQMHEPYEYHLPNDERIEKVQVKFVPTTFINGHTGLPFTTNIIKGLKFITTKSRSIPPNLDLTGDGVETEYFPGYTLRYVTGRSGLRIDQLQFFWHGTEPREMTIHF